jgi:LPXTG-site transpeptidase (sortase) family protein
MSPQNSFFDAVWSHKVPFAVAFFCVFTLSYGILFALDWLPEPKITDAAEATEVKTETASVGNNTEPVETTPVVNETVVIPVAAIGLPIEMTIPALDRTVKVLNPASRTIAALDEALLDGVVRHPDSAKLGEEGNVFILGHSSYLPNVFNKNFQAFNGIQNLKWGDTIELKSGEAIYIYRVDKVYKAKASAVTVPIGEPGKRLTLATCNSFGSTDDRFIVEAELIETKGL